MSQIGPIHNAKQMFVDAEDMTMTITSDSFLIDDVSNYAVQFIWEGGAGNTGDLVVQGSIDGINFADVSVTTIASDDGSLIIDPGMSSNYSYVRIEWRPAAGSGSLTVWYNLKIR